MSSKEHTLILIIRSMVQAYGVVDEILSDENIRHFDFDGKTLAGAAYELSESFFENLEYQSQGNSFMDDILEKIHANIPEIIAFDCGLKNSIKYKLEEFNAENDFEKFVINEDEEIKKYDYIRDIFAILTENDEITPEIIYDVIPDYFIKIGKFQEIQEKYPKFIRELCDYLNDNLTFDDEYSYYDVDDSNNIV